MSKIIVFILLFLLVYSLAGMFGVLALAVLLEARKHPIRATFAAVLLAGVFIIYAVR